ncbi:MAG: dipicolinate synthase subunit DpsA [Oscillospiraceae bacterium]|jgi:dipicolinate synthase subunit A|nr:dipicolinate synthase subunit DpsA [Oscillospiraceae bacterium]
MFVNNYAILGGDKRQIALIENLAKDGANLWVVGFDKINFDNRIIKTNAENAIKNSYYIIFPLPVTKDGILLNSPFGKNKLVLNDKLAKKLYNKKIFCGTSEKLLKLGKIWEKLNIIDYSKNLEFAIRNSVPTAEGAIEIAMHEYPETVNGSKCLVAGFGNLGKALSELLYGMKAKVTVSARKTEDIANIECRGYKSILTSKIKETNDYDIVFNTIPDLIFDAKTLKKFSKDCIIIDLASAPGGVDFKTASKLGIKAIQALSLPGKVAPKTAGLIIKKTIYNIIKKEEIK